MTISIRPLCPEDVDLFRALRLFAIRETPDAFCTTYESESALPLIRMQERLLHTRWQRIFGAFDGAHLVGIAGFKREPIAVQHDRVNIWGVYVAPEARGAGVARALMEAALDYARTIAELQKVTLSVRPGNTAAKALYFKLGFALAGQAPQPGQEEQMLLLL